MSNLSRKIWILAGRSAYKVVEPGVKLVVRNSRRSRILLVFENEYLVVKHWLGDGAWMLPGGGQHRHEEPLAGARRELNEELGISPPPSAFAHAGRYESNDRGFSFSYDLYIVRLTERPVLRLQRIEILSAAWFDRTALLPGPATPVLAVALDHWSQ